MPWDGSGQFVRIFGATGWVNDAATAVNILASRHDTHDQDIAVGIQNAITKDGQSKPAAHLIPNVGNTYDLGSVATIWRALYVGVIHATTFIGTLLSSSIVYARTAAETTALVVPTDLSFLPGDVRRYGALVDGVTDDSAAVNNAVAVAQVAGNLGTEILFPGGTCRCQITIAGVAVGLIFRGVGKGQTVLKAISATADVFKFTAGASVWGLLIEKMQIVGAGGSGAPGSNSTDGSGIHFPTGLNFPPYDVVLRDLYIAGFGRSCVYDQAGIFTSRLENVGGNNSINHNFDLGGGNTLHLIGCYAHGPAVTNLTFTGSVAAAATSATLTSNWLYATDTYYISFSSGERRAVTLTNGANTCTWTVGLTFAASATAKLLSAGYRIRSGSPTLIGCNGIDQGNVWGMFSNSVSEDGSTAYCSPTLIECNIESFADIGIRNKQGGVSFIHSTVLGHAQDVVGILIEPVNSSLRGVLDVDVPYGNTAAAIPVTFTGAPVGSSATLTANWAFSSGVWVVTFSDAEVRSVTLTNGATTATWSGALTGSPTANATATNWRNGYAIHTNAAGGAPFAAIISPAGNAQVSSWREDTSSVLTQSCIGASSIIASNRFAATIFDLVSLGVIKSTQHAQTRVAITYSTSMTPDASAGCIQEITATDGVGFTINAPTNPLAGQFLTLRLKNTSGGALGAITLNAAYHVAAAFPTPANTKNQSVTFYYDGIWAEVSRTSADVAN